MRGLRRWAPAVLAMLLTACAGDVIGDFPSPPTPLITASPSASADPSSGLLAEIAVEGSPCFLTEAGGSVWVTSFDGEQLSEIDPSTNEVVETYPMPRGPCGMVAIGDVLWIQAGNGTIVRFDARRGREIDRRRLRVVGLVTTPSGLWGLSPQGNAVVHLDPRTGAELGRVRIEPPLVGLAADDGAIWTVSGREALVRIDPARHAIADRIVLERFEPEGVTIDGRFLWVSSSFEAALLHVDTKTGEVIGEVETDAPLFGGVVIGDSFWGSANDGTIYRLDARSGQILEQRELLGFGPIPAAGNLWTIDFLSDAVYRLDEPAA